jgi:hypothetical protein
MAKSKPARDRPPRFLFLATVVLSAGLILLVIAAPAVDNAASPSAGGGRVVRLFARDPTLRRTTVASAVGLLVTACVFFRLPPEAPKAKPLRDVAGA